MCCCKNVGTLDRSIRLFVGLALFALAFGVLRLNEGALPGIVAAAIGGVMLLTAALGVCPLYVPLRLSTCGATSCPKQP